MTRTVALRAVAIFVTLSIIFASIGASTFSPVAEALFAIAASLCAVMLLFAVAPPARAAVPVRIRRRL